MNIKDKKIEEKEKPCQCETHIKMDALRKDPIPCVGHGEGCPCTEKLLLEKGCACSLDGVPNPKFTSHAVYECKNDEVGVLKA